MEEKFWHKAWGDNKIGFHLPEVNPSIEKFGEKLLLESKGNAFLPMCGKTLDLLWFSEKVDHVYGVELSEKAILDFFEENNLKFSTHQKESFKVFTSKNISIYCGDFFKFPIRELNVDVVFDRGALGALPVNMREKYYQKMKAELKKGSSWLLSVFDYPQNKMEGPPFSVDQKEIQKFAGRGFKVVLLEESITNDFGISELKLNTYFLKN